MQIKIIRSKRRRRTASAQVVKDTLVVRVPLALSGEHLQKVVIRFKEKAEQDRLKAELERGRGIVEVASRLNGKYFGGRLRINSIEYVTGQESRFGCCDYRAGRIRISHKVGFMPRWVRDYVLIHEMAHLLEPNHSRAFWDIVSRYKLAERARGYLIAMGSMKYTKQEV